MTVVNGAALSQLLSPVPLEHFGDSDMAEGGA